MKNVIFLNKTYFGTQQKCFIGNSQKGIPCEFENRYEKNSSSQDFLFEQKCRTSLSEEIKSIKISGISGFSTVFDRLVLEAQWELDNVSGHFWYLLILKRSFLAMVAVSSGSRVLKWNIEDSRIWQNPICTTLTWATLATRTVFIINGSKVKKWEQK